MLKLAPMPASPRLPVRGARGEESSQQSDAVKHPVLWVRQRSLRCVERPVCGVASVKVDQTWIGTASEMLSGHLLFPWASGTWGQGARCMVSLLSLGSSVWIEAGEATAEREYGQGEGGGSAPPPRCDHQRTASSLGATGMDEVGRTVIMVFC